MREKHKKRRKMLANREKRAKRWLFTDDKPKTGLHEVSLQDFRQRWLYAKGA